MSLGDERGSVQERILKYSTEVGWEYLSPDEALRLREGEGNVILREVFLNQIQKLNPNVGYEEAQEVLRRVERVPANIEGNLTAWEFLKGLKQIFLQSEKREVNVKLLDDKNINNNVFHVTDELKFVSGNNVNRYDIVFFINGFPILLIETKAAHKIDGLVEAFEQIKRYHRETPEALSLLQLFSITHLIEFYYGPTWNLSSKGLNRWKNRERPDFEGLIKSFFNRGNILKTITDYILFPKRDDRLTKIILKSHQQRAVKKVVERAKDRKKRRGLIWHTQGSGKTYTMITAARLILEKPEFENPTVIMLVDRNELEQQLFSNLSSLGMEVRVALSKRDLRELLSLDYRGLIVSTIHKFQGMPARINTRRNIFVFIDEAHRSTEGDLGNYMMAALPNATIIGFTGTPRDKTKHGKGTFLTFGVDDPPYGYLDRYTILESIEDGTTLKINYALAENRFLPKKELLEKEFLNLKEAEGISDLETLNRILQRAVTLRNFLKNRERVDAVAEFVARHFRENVEPMGYKAFLVAVDREACALYKEALDRYLPPEYSEVVISKNHNDPEHIKRFHHTEEEEKLIRKRFKEEETPKVLIVTEKLLTGFDAPILYAMYLDKPMRDHVLLQAIARVNRPYEDESGRKKPAGLIIDFVGILKNLEKALAFDSSDIEGVLNDLETLKGHFKDLMEEGRENFLNVVEGKERDKAVEAVLNGFSDEERRHRFYEFYREVKEIYEILSPDPVLRPYINDFAIYTRMFNILKQAYDEKNAEERILERELSEKVKRLIEGAPVDAYIKDSLEVVEIDEKTLERLLKSKATDIEKVFNLIKSIEVTVRENLRNEPYLISIGERAEKIAREYRERQRGTKETLEVLKSLSEEILRARKEFKSLGISKEAFALYWTVKMEGGELSEAEAKEIEKAFNQHPLWRENSEEFKQLNFELTPIMINLFKGNVRKAVKLLSKTLEVLKRDDL